MDAAAASADAAAIGVQIGSAQIGGNLIVAYAATVAATRFTGVIEAFLEEYLVTEEGPGVVPFGGREEELGLLDSWLGDDGAPPRYVLAAPAGRGKSALLVHWIRRLAENGRAGNGEEAWRIAFVPISMRFSTNRPEVFYEALAARLAEILGKDLQPAHTDPVAYYEDQCRRLLGEAIAREMRVLLVMDGIDEALGGSARAGSPASPVPACACWSRPGCRSATGMPAAGSSGSAGTRVCACRRANFQSCSRIAANPRRSCENGRARRFYLSHNDHPGH